MELYFYNGTKQISSKQAVEVRDESSLPRPLENEVVNLYPEIRYQTLTGFGGAMTEAAAWSAAQLSEEERRKALEAYFGKDGAGYTVIRTHIDSADFALGMYQAVEDVTADPSFNTFSLKRDLTYIIPAIREAMEISERPLSVLLSPWSPPAEWKTESALLGEIAASGDLKQLFTAELADAEVSEANPLVSSMMEALRERRGDGSGTRRFGGHLKMEHYGDWAAYLVKYIQAYLDEGIPVKWLSIQNEAQAATPWDSCEWTPDEEKTFLRDHLYPAMKEAGLTDKIGILFWDHNKENLVDRALHMLDQETLPMLQGAAFHWYSGDHFEAVQILHEQYPDLKLVFSEGCCMYDTGEEAELLHAEQYAHDIIGNLNAGMDTWFDWNLFLDERGGPNHVGNFCSAPVMLDGQGSFRKCGSYHYIRAFSQNLLPGAQRIGFTKYTGALEVTAFQNPDGTIVCILLNRTEEELPVNLRLHGKRASEAPQSQNSNRNFGAFAVPPRSIAVVRCSQ